MIDDEAEPLGASDKEDRLGQPLDGLSLDELHAYLARLDAEIVRTRAAIAAKQAAQGAAESLFRKG